MNNPILNPQELAPKIQTRKIHQLSENYQPANHIITQPTSTKKHPRNFKTSSK
jgi:hypothetical protein